MPIATLIIKNEAGDTMKIESAMVHDDFIKDFQSFRITLEEHPDAVRVYKAKREDIEKFAIQLLANCGYKIR